MAAKAKIDTIGTVELVNLPEVGLLNIPSKVDTGAESSAIWASSVKINKGGLEFKLFAPGSAFYTGKTIRTKDFQTATIRNSFGTKEFRYKVDFLASIGNRKIRTLFTLADRSGMTYPILIGRNTLRNKYIVDVSKHKVHGESRGKRKVLILTTNPEDYKGFFDNVRENLSLNVEFTLRDYKDLVFFMKPGKVKVIETINNKSIGNFEIVYLKSHKSNYSQAISAAQYLQFRGIKFFDKELLSHIAYDKLSSYMKLATHNMPIPYTICASKDYLQKNIRELGEQIGWPLVCKEINSNRGKKNYFMRNQAEAKKILKDADSEDLYLLQEYVPNNGWVRALVFSKAAELFIGRHEIAHKDPRRHHLNSPFGSKNAYLITENDIDPMARDLAIRAADLTNRQVAGVDLIRNKSNNRWLILEVNNSPQFKSGAFVEEKEKTFAKFIDRELNR